MPEDPTPAATPAEPGRLPPRWFIRLFWALHRALFRLTGGRFGLRPPTPKQWGMMRLHTVGRRSGKARIAILGYYEDGPNLVTMAMNGWGEPEPAWWLNAQAQPNATVDLVNGRRAVRIRAAAVGFARALDRLERDQSRCSVEVTIPVPSRGTRPGVGVCGCAPQRHLQRACPWPLSLQGKHDV